MGNTTYNTPNVNTPQFIGSEAHRNREWQHVWPQLSGIDIKLLDELAYLCRKQAAKSQIGAKYCIPGRAYLARKVGVNIWTISRHTHKLARLGMLEVVRRRKVGGRWQTNMYRLISWVAWRVARVRQLIDRVASHVRLNAHKAPPRDSKIAHRPGFETFQEILDRWRARGQGS